MPEHCSNVNTSIDTCFRMSSFKLHINDPIDKTLNSVRQLQCQLISHLSNVFVHLINHHPFAGICLSSFLYDISIKFSTPIFNRERAAINCQNIAEFLLLSVIIRWK